ncbi:hypothetical protein N9934_05115, partial [Desulfosarcina sp.]|nr:hypothetical protein [Desulfosarcina sp.]
HFLPLCFHHHSKCISAYVKLYYAKVSKFFSPRFLRSERISKTLHPMKSGTKPYRHRREDAILGPNCLIGVKN